VLSPSKTHWLWASRGLADWIPVAASCRLAMLRTKTFALLFVGSLLLPALTGCAAKASFQAGGGEAWLDTPSGELSAGSTPTRTQGQGVVVPIDVDGRRFGRLELDARARGGPFHPRDIAALGLAAERLGMALGAPRAADA